MDRCDIELLRQYGREGAEEAFRELTRRHLDLVWGAAWRVTGDAELARDVAQTVFTDLARKAAWLPQQTNLRAWLHRAAVFAARKMVRSNQRRAAREREAMENDFKNEAEAGGEESVGGVLPLLDEALNALPQADREAVMLRFFAGKSFVEVGEALRVSDDAAQKRLSRAVEKLRRFLGRRGFELSAAGVGSALGAAAAQAAPAGFAAGVAGAAISATGATTGLALLHPFVSSAAEQLMIMKTKVLIGTFAAAGVVAPLVIQQQTIGGLSAEIVQLEGEGAGLEALQQGEREAERRRALGLELNRLRQGAEELLELQEEAERLRGLAERVTPELRREEAAARVAFEEAQALAEQAEAEVEAEELRENTVQTMKLLGLAARIYAAENGDRLPLSLEQMKDVAGPEELPGGISTKELPGGLSLERFEFVEHERPVEESELEMLLLREKTPRRLPDGRWARAYTLVDGSVQNRESVDGNFGDFERPRIGRLEGASQEGDPR